METDFDNRQNTTLAKIQDTTNYKDEQHYDIN